MIHVIGLGLPFVILSDLVAFAPLFDTDNRESINEAKEIA
jgi:hypothetical protein